MLTTRDIDSDFCKKCRGVVFDIDDTVTHHGYIDPEAYHLMWRVRASGMFNVAATGRPAGWAEVLAWQWPVEGVIAENGACWFSRDENALLFSETVTQSKEQAEALDALVQEALGVFPWLRLTRDIHLRRIDRTFDIGEFETVSEEHKKELRAWFEKHGCVVMDSSIHSHVSWRPYSKAEGVQHLLTTCSSLDTDTVKENFIFIGDNLNDEPAFEYFTHSVGVQNITPILPKLSSRPRFITQASYGQGFVEVVEYILSHRS